MIVLREGDRGPEVRKLQLLLNTQRLEGHRLTADGSFGPKTVRALKEFQKRKGLEQDAVAGPATWRALGIEQKNASAKHQHIFEHPAHHAVRSRNLAWCK